MTGLWSQGSAAIRLIVDELAERLGRSVVVDDPLVRQLYASRHFNDEDPARVRAVLQHEAGPDVVRYVLGLGVERWPKPGRIPAEPGLELLPRFCAPLRARGEFLGMLMVIDADESLAPSEVRDIEATAAALAAQLSVMATDHHRDERASAVRRLLSTSAADRESAAEQLSLWGFRDRPHVVVSLVEVSSPLHSEAQLELALRAAQGQIESASKIRGLGTVSGQRAEFVQQWLSPPDPDQLHDQGRRLRDTLLRVLGASAHCVVGIGSAVAGTTEAFLSRRQARVALRAARCLERTNGIGVWDDLGEYAPLLCISDELPAGTRAEQALQAIEAHETGFKLRETLTVYLDEAGNVPRAAKVLNLHRTSLYYRLKQIQEITGMDLDSGTDRLALHLQLRLRDISTSELQFSTDE
ncbi:helix-turn-helix domain-containing protein [Streptomyces sp. NPDC000151]|uniref:PucR family transcriptional regulator n=1 Tax=Streptomyces sp. NPDC000151 TaxID=3154244 RepID=UPI0033260C22